MQIWIMTDKKHKKPLSLYIHIPFCKKRCSYCDFNTYAGFEEYMDVFSEGVQFELELFAQKFRDDFVVKTVFFGGGTPTVMSPGYFASILKSISKNFSVSDWLEVTCEGNPNNINKDYCSELIKMGINRLSIGMQSSDDHELKILDRMHNHQVVINAVHDAKSVGFRNINLDLIYGIPTQSMKTFNQSIDAALDLKPQHLSIYGLSLAQSTPLFQRIQKGELPELENDQSGEMYEWVMDYMPKFRFEQYEISNWALENYSHDYRCMHNIQYWKNLDYLGIGPGAHSYVNGWRWCNVDPIPMYVENLRNIIEKDGFSHGAIKDSHQLGKMDIIKETMMMGLRLVRSGVNIEEMNKRFSIDLLEIYERQVEKLLQLKLIKVGQIHDSSYIWLTKKGRMLGNQVFLEFI